MSNNVGFSALGWQVSGQEIASIAEALDAATVLIVDNHQAVKEVLQRRPQTRIIFRSYWPQQGGDDNLHLKVTPEEYVVYMGGWMLPESVLWYAVNEPTAGYAELTAWTERVIALLQGRQQRCVFGNFATGTPEVVGHNDWAERLAPFLRAVTENGHYVGLHEYINLTISDSIPYHIGRFRYLLDACRVTGIKPPHLLITETGYDIAGSWQQLRLLPEQFAASMNILSELYAPYGICPLMFVAGDWYSHSGQFDIRPALQALKERRWPSYRGESNMSWKSAKLTVHANSLNVRDLPRLTGRVIGVLKSGIHEIMILDGALQTGDSYEWAQIAVEGKQGYVALRNLTTGDALATYTIMGSVDLATLQTRLAEIEEELRDMRRALNAIREELIALKEGDGQINQVWIRQSFIAIAGALEKAQVWFPELADAIRGHLKE